MSVAILVVLLLLALGAPLFAAIAALALLGFQRAGYDLIAVPVEMYRLGDMPGLIAIPLFTLAGYVMAEGSGPRRLVRLSNAIVGWLPGGLAVVAIVACAFFTAFTGASGVTIVALGALLYPALLHAGYPRRYALGLVTAGGSLGLLFAPSLPLILYGFVAAQLGTQPAVQMGELFLAGIVPGLLMLAVLGAHALWVGRALPQATHRFDWREVGAALWESRWELPLPPFVLGGIYSGAFAASEAAAVTAMYVLLVALFARRELPLRRLPALMAESMRMVGAILIILAAALAMSNWLIDQDVPGKLFALIQSSVRSSWGFLLLLNGFLLLVGMLLDIFSAIVLLVPLLLPIAVGYGIHPVHFGIVMLANLQLGYFTPPVGMNLFIAAYRFQTPLLTLVRASLPFLLLLALAVALITWWPALSLFGVSTH